MTDTAAALAALGWRVDTPARLTRAVRDFQSAWNLGSALVVDGVAGPSTRAALRESVGRKAAGMPDISAHFSAREFACNCGGRWADCRRIWTPRSTIQLAERYRTLVGPFSPERAGRCPRENARVGGASKSTHLDGKGLDLPIYDVTVAQVRKVTGADGIGTYSKGGRLYVRHIDNRGSRAQWPYPYKPFTPLRSRPDLAAAPAPPLISPDPAEDLMSLTVKNPATGKEWAADAALWSIWTYSIKASQDAAAALAVVRALAAKGAPLTAAETEAAVRDAISDIAAAADVAADAVASSAA